MKPNEETIFAEALNMQGPQERAEFLDKACAGDPGLRKSVESLLSAYDVGEFLEAGAPDMRGTIDLPPIKEKPGAVIGPYKLLQQIGEGGMGTVFMAEQSQPVHRKVALKIIKPGMDSKQVIARFEAERQALALMDHPNIAKVLDAGATEAGRPYFVMELVKGVPITKYCDEHRLTLPQRLELFVSVCQAVQHAHQKGIIHRDLKPSNVLIAQYDGRPVPKVIDFGIAKAAGQRLTEKTLFTELGQIVGTFEYMSPEQAELNQLDIDTRSDIYSLGVLLYELLTGTTPLERQRFKNVAFLEVLRLIREEESPTPSARLSTTDELPSIAANRGLEPKKLNGLVRGELDWIVMKALDKDRDRRYETANGFAADVQRYLNDEPVQACPPSAVYRLKKFARRNNAALTFAGVVVASLLILGVGVGWIARDQTARRWQANENVREALDAADVHLADGNPYARDLVTAVRKAEAQPDAELVSAELRERLDRVRSDLAMLATLERARLEGAAVTQKGFDTSRAAKAYAQAFQEYGISVETLTVDEAGARVRERNIALHLVAALDNWAGLLLSERRTTEAKHLLAVGSEADRDPWRNQLRSALASKNGKLLEELARAASVDELQAPSLELLGDNLMRAGQFPAAVTLLERAQRRFPADFWINTSLGLVLLQTRPADSVSFSRAAVALRPESPGVHLNLGIGLANLGRSGEAIACYKEALRLKPDFAMAHLNLGGELSEQGKYDEAVVSLRVAMGLRPDDAVTHYNLGLALSKQRKLGEAIAHFKQAIRFKPGLAQAYCSLASALEKEWKVEEAIDVLKEARRINPKSARVHNDLGTMLMEQRKTAEGIASFSEAIRLNPGDALQHSNLGSALAKQGELKKAIESYRTAIRLDPKLAEAHNYLGSAFADQGDLADAIRSHGEAISLKPDYAGAHSNLGVAFGKQGRLDKAIASFKEAIRFDPNEAEAYNNLGAAYSLNKQPELAIAILKKAIGLKKDFAEVYYNLGVAHVDNKQPDEAIVAYMQAIDLKKDYAQAYYNLGVVLLEKKQPKLAIAPLEKAIALKKDYSEAYHNLGVAYADTKQTQKAIRAIQQAILLNKNSFEAYHDLGVVYLNNRESERAITVLRQGILLKKDDASLHYNLASAIRNTGNFEEARAFLQKALQLASKDSEVLQLAPGLIKTIDLQQRVQNQLKKLAKVGRTEAFEGQLTKAAPVLDGKHSKTYAHQFKAGQHYLIDLISTEFDTYLMVKNAGGMLLAEDDDGGQNTDSRLLFVPKTDGEYTIVVQALEAGATGGYTLRIQEYRPGNGDKQPDASAVADERERQIALREKTTKEMAAQLGPDDPATLTSMHNLALAYQFGGKLDEALSLHLETLKKRIAKLGPDDPQTWASKDSLSLLYGMRGQFEKAEPLLRELLERNRKRIPQGIADQLAGMGLNLIKQKKYAAAEPFFRESWEMHEKKQPDAFRTFHVKSLIGEALLGQKKYKDAEPLLLTGYEGMAQRKPTLATTGALRMAEAAERLVLLYEAMSQDEKTKEWRQKLDIHREAEKKAAKAKEK